MTESVIREVYGWWIALSYGDLLWAVVYGAVAGGLAAGGYAWFTVRRKNFWVAQMRVMPCRYVRLPPERREHAGTGR